MRKLRAYLMRAAGYQLAVYQGHVARHGQRLVARLRALSAGRGPLEHAHASAALGLEYVVVHHAVRPGQAAQRYAQVVLFDAALAYAPVHGLQGGLVLGEYHYAAGEAVDAVAGRGGKRALGHGVVFALLVQVGAHVRDQRVQLLLGVGVHDYAGPLVYQQYVGVLVHYVQMPVELAEQRVGFVRLFKQLVVYVKLKHVALGQPGVPRGSLAVHLNALQAYVLLAQPGGKQRQLGQQPLVQPLAVVLAVYRKLSHVAAVTVH